MRILCLVPTPLAAARAARRLCDAQGGVLLGAPVATLERVAADVLVGAGDRRPVLPALAERIVAADAAREAGGPLAAARPGTGLADAAAAAIAELRRGGVAAADAAAAAAGLTGAPAARLGALAAALAAYEARLAALGVLDGAGALAAAGAAVRRGASPEHRALDLLVLDGFAALAPGAWELFAALAARARRTRVHAPFFPERPDACAAAEPLVRRIEALHDLGAGHEVELVLPAIEGAGRAPLPAALLAALAGGAAAPAAEGGRVLALAGAGEDGEAAAIARLAARLVEEDGVAPEELAVLAPGPRAAAGRLAAAFAAAGVPFAAARGTPLAEAPPVRAVRDALDAAAAGLGRRAAERLAASGWLAPRGLPAVLGPALERAGALEGRAAPAAALRARAAGLAAPAASRERALLERAADALDDLARALRPLGATGTARAHAARLASLVEAGGLRRRAARAPRDLAARGLAALARLVEVADGLAEALALAGRGGEPLGAAEWAALLGEALDGASLPPAPEPAAGAVELLGLEEAPGASFRAAILAGCARGAWPPAPAADPLLREPERAALNRALRRAAVPVAAARRAEALHRAFSAAAAGREVVAFAWAARGPAGGGGALAPLVVEALAAVGVPPPDVPEGAPGLGAARSAREALRAAARLARSGRGDAAEAALARAGLGARARDARRRGEIEALRREAVRARRAAPFAGELGAAALPALAAALPGEWSPTQLESHARCPFRLLLQLGAGLPDPAAPDLDLDARDEGSLLHAALERFVAGRMARGAWPPAEAPRDLAEARAAAEEAIARFQREGRTGDPAVLAARREAVLARVERIVRAEARDHDGLAPAAVEHRFGGSSGRAPLAFEAGGERVLVKGRVDRIDASPGRLLVLDYKNARSGEAYAELLAPEALGVTSFQAPVYALAAARDLPGRARVEATYALLRRATRLAPVALDVAALRAGGEGGPPFGDAVVAAVGRIRAGAFPIASRDCSGCPFGAVCRFQGAAETGAGEAAA